MSEKRDRLAFLGGFLSMDPSAPHGTNHAGQAICKAIARLKTSYAIDVFHENAGQLHQFGAVGPHRLEIPAGDTPITLRERRELPFTTGIYKTLYVTHGGFADFIPHALRPVNDWVPVICEVDISHKNTQWWNVLAASLTGSLRPTDGFVFKSGASERLFLRVWRDWNERFSRNAPVPRTVVSYNGINLAANRHNSALRAETRRELHLRDDDVVFLAFSRLERHLKGDMRALVVLWKHVLAAAPHAVLVLTGALHSVERPFVEELLACARELGIANRVIIVRNPYELWGNARNRLMSAADVFLHLTTGVEEACPLTVLEAMAHGVPPLVTKWSGLAETVNDGVTGWHVPTLSGTIPSSILQSCDGRDGRFYGGEVSRLAALDARRFVELAIGAARNSELRAAIGERARKRVEEAHDLEGRARERLAFVEELAVDAERSWSSSSPAWQSSIVDMNIVLGSLASSPLGPSDRLELLHPSDAALLPGFDVPARRTVILAIIEHLTANGPTSGADLVAVLSEDDASNLERDALYNSEVGRAYQQLFMQCLAYGVVSVARRESA